MYSTGLEQEILHAWRKWVLRGRKELANASPTQPAWQLTTTARHRFSMLAVFLLFSTVYTFVFFIDTDLLAGEPAWMRLVVQVGSAGIWLLTTYVTVTTWVERLDINEIGLSRLSLRGRQSLPWPSLASVELGKDEDAIQLVGRDSQRVSVIIYFDGFQTLLSYLERHSQVSDPVRERLLNPMSKPFPSPARSRGRGERG